MCGGGTLSLGIGGSAGNTVFGNVSLSLGNTRVVIFSLSWGCFILGVDDNRSLGKGGNVANLSPSYGTFSLGGGDLILDTGWIDVDFCLS